MIAYADTSFLASLYGTDVNSESAVRQIESSRPGIVVTPFNELELTAAFEAMVFRKRLEAAEVAASMRLFRADLLMAVLLQQPVPPNSFERATALSRLRTRTLGSRTLDILHVAIAVELDAELFLTFDKDQAVLARRAGLTVRPGR